MKFLICEDSGTMRTIQRRCLNQLGIDDIVEAEDGRQGIEAFENDTFDVVISDWNMPHMDGLELLKAIRSRNKDVPVLMVTTEAERSRVVTAIQAGCTDYLVKPFTPDALKEKLKRWVSVPC